MCVQCMASADAAVASGILGLAAARVALRGHRRPAEAAPGAGPSDPGSHAGLAGASTSQVTAEH